jgi:hypothetical protein
MSTFPRNGKSSGVERGKPLALKWWTSYASISIVSKEEEDIVVQSHTDVGNIEVRREIRD